MNKYLWSVMAIFIIAASYGMYRVIFYNPTEQITNAKLDLGAGASPVKESPSAIGPLAPQVNDAYLIGKWQNSSQAKQTVEYKTDNTIIEYTAGRPTAQGTWKFETTANASPGNANVLKISINGQTITYQVLNLSATNLSYIAKAEKGIESFNRLP